MGQTAAPPAPEASKGLWGQLPPWQCHRHPKNQLARGRDRKEHETTGFTWVHECILFIAFCSPVQ